MDVKDKGNGTYLAEYTVPDHHTSVMTSDHQRLSRQYTLSVCFRRAHIKGSPFVVNVTCGSPQSGTGNKEPQVLRSSSSSSLQYKPISSPVNRYSYDISDRTTCADKITATGSRIKSANLGKKVNPYGCLPGTGKNKKRVVDDVPRAFYFSFSLASPQHKEASTEEREYKQ